MRDAKVKIYGHLYPVPEECFKMALDVVNSWHLKDDFGEIVEYTKDMINISYEGDFFPCDEIIEILKSFHNETTQGKLDCINVEKWTLNRHFFELGKEYRQNTASLNHALEKLH